MMKANEIVTALEKMIPEAKCELIYNKDYELLIATVLSAQATDKRVNKVTKKLFSNYNLEDISKLDLNKIEDILRPLGTFRRKAVYLKEIATSLLENHNGSVPNDRKYLESLPGVGHKTCNVVLSNLYDEDCMAVDTHVTRVSKRLGLALETDDVTTIEKKLVKKFKGHSLKDLHHRLVLFGRYICVAKKPKCSSCWFQKDCNYYKKLH
ncbi:MAG: endonuclease III [Bacilli bacterium]|nr:endonuclease III [Bacilli bacterium]